MRGGEQGADGRGSAAPRSVSAQRGAFDLETFLTQEGRRGVRLSPAELATVTELVASHPETWAGRVTPQAEERVYERLLRAEELEVWVLGWEAGQQTIWHDHGGSSGCLRVVQGELVEEYRAPSGRLRRRQLATGTASAFGPAHVHNVRREVCGPAISIHTYSPPLRTMTYYQPTPMGLSAIETRLVDGPEDAFLTIPPPTSVDASETTIADLLGMTRAALDRVTPEVAAARISQGAVLVDTRPFAQRLADGEVPGAVIIERNVLEWRLDPSSDARLDWATSPDLHVIVMCNEGYASSLAAATLRQLGLRRATDLDGGFQAWKRAGLPVRPAVASAAGAWGESPPPAKARGRRTRAAPADTGA